MKKNIKIKFLFWIIILAFILSLVLVQKMGKKMNPIILKYSEIEAKRFATYMVNSSLDKKFLNSLDDNLFKIKKDSNGNIELIDIKSRAANILLEDVTKKVQSGLLDLENGNIKNMDLADTFYGKKFKNIKKGVVCEVPAGVIFSNSLLSNTGPVIPIKFNFIGQVLTNLDTKISSYGINSVYMEVYIKVEVNEQITMPLRTKNVTTEVDIPLSMKVIQGTIPNYYQNLIEKQGSSFSLPLK